MKVRDQLEHASGPSEGVGRPTIVLIDDAQLMRRAVRRALTRAGMPVVGEADCAETGLQVVLDARPDVVLMDFVLRGSSHIDAIERIAELAPASRILVLTANTERDCLLQAIKAGACGYILKDTGTAAIVRGDRASAEGECALSSEVAGVLLERVRERDIRLAAGAERTAGAIRAGLTERELQIFKRLASGESNHEIAHAFSLSENTVKNHVASILAKLHLNNRVQAAAQAVRSGLSCVAGLFLLEAMSDEADLASAVMGVLLGG